MLNLAVNIDNHWIVKCKMSTRAWCWLECASQEKKIYYSVATKVSYDNKMHGLMIIISDKILHLHTIFGRIHKIAKSDN